jgi:hypothetical protein
MVLERRSENAVSASSNETPCRERFSAALPESHSNVYSGRSPLSGIAYPSSGGLTDGR